MPDPSELTDPFPMRPAAGATETEPVGTGSTRLPSLDGWRAVSIAMVLGSHSVVLAGMPPSLGKLLNRLCDGALGVRFFFVISGFLITWLMMAEDRRSGTVSLRNFYSRRALRILPVYFVFLGVVALLQCFTPFHQSPALWVGNLTFTTNFLHEPGALGHNSAHLWSLAVEEQFYLLWPAAFLWLRRREPGLVCRCMVGLALGVVFINRWLAGSAWSSAPVVGTLFQDWSFFNAVDSLAIGCAAALLLGRYPQAIEAKVGARAWQTLVLGVVLIQCPYVIHKIGESALFPPSVGMLCEMIWRGLTRTIQSFGFALLLLQSVLMPRWGPYRLLNLKLVAWIGVLSYSIYIWQQLFCGDPAAFGLPPVWWMSFPGWMVPALAVAVLSYYGLEQPLLRLRNRFR